MHRLIIFSTEEKIMSLKKRMAKTIGYTIICLVSVYAFYAFVEVMSMSHLETWILICFAIVIIFLIIFCTLTIIDKINNMRNEKDE
jgi:membrane protein DedA with SNARE-associated domain